VPETLTYLRLRRGDAVAEARPVEGSGILYFCSKDWCPHYQGQLGLLAGAETMVCALVQHSPDHICQPFYLEVAEDLDRNRRQTWQQRLDEAEAFERAMTAGISAGTSSPGLAPINSGREEAEPKGDRMRRFPVPIVPVVPIFLLLALVLTGCGTLNRLTAPLGQAATTLFTSATLADLQLVGVRSGPLVPVQAGPGTAAVLGEETQQELTGLLGEAPLGVLLPISRVGETTPWWIFCPAGELQARCEEIPPNAQVSFTGHPLGRGAVLLPTRLTWSAR
jgi:hypothetical protein